MRRYECVVIIDPDISEEQREQIFGRVLDLLPQSDGFLVEQEDWGVRKLAYAIRKKVRGHYFRLDFCGNGALVDEMERFYRIDDRVLKYMTVLLEKGVDVDSLKEEVAAKEAQKEAEKAAAADAEKAAAVAAAEKASDAAAAEKASDAADAEKTAVDAAAEKASDAADAEKTAVDAKAETDASQTSKPDNKTEES